MNIINKNIFLIIYLIIYLIIQLTLIFNNLVVVSCTYYHLFCSFKTKALFLKLFSMTSSNLNIINHLKILSCSLARCKSFCLMIVRSRFRIPELIPWFFYSFFFHFFFLSFLSSKNIFWNLISNSLGNSYYFLILKFWNLISNRYLNFSFSFKI